MLLKVADAMCMYSMCVYSVICDRSTYEYENIYGTF